MWHHINTEMVGKNSFNLSRPAMHIGYFAGVINLLESNDKLPKNALILDIAPSDILASNQEKLKNDIHYLRYYYNKSKFIKNEINKAQSFEFIKYWSNLYRHNGNIDLLLFNEIRGVGKELPPQGFLPLNGNYSINKSILEREESAQEKNKFETDYFLSQIDIIKSICDRNNIDFICITSPYLNKINSKLSQKIEEIFKQKKIHFINFNKSPKWRQNHDIWHDELHLNSKGADLLTKSLIDSLRLKTSQ